MNQQDTEERVDTSTPEQQAEAAKLGWSPIEKWRGDPEGWVDAKTFLDRGKTMLPLLKATNRRLEEQVAELTRANASLKGEIGEINSNMKEFLESQKAMLRDRLADQRKQLLAEKKSAREEGDDAALDEIDEQLATNREQVKKLESDEPAKKKGETPPQKVEDPPEVIAWRQANPWYGGPEEDDVMLTALAGKYAAEAMQRGLTRQAFLDYIDEKMAPRLKKSAPASKVEGGGPSGSGGGGSSKGYNALPPDAKRQCDAEEKRFVGDKKVFKTKEAWRAHFVSQYFQGEGE